MKLIDTSSWVHQMRPKGDTGARLRVESLLQSGEAAWCPMVRLELWRGINDEAERKILRHYEARLTDLNINDDVWRLACDLASRSRKSGLTCPASDILIAACARFHGVVIEHSDAHFEIIAKL